MISVFVWTQTAKEFGSIRAIVCSAQMKSSRALLQPVIESKQARALMKVWNPHHNSSEKFSGRAVRWSRSSARPVGARIHMPQVHSLRSVGYNTVITKVFWRTGGAQRELMGILPTELL